MHSETTTDPSAAPYAPARAVARLQAELATVRGELATLRAERDQLRGGLADVLAEQVQLRAQLAHTQAQLVAVEAERQELVDLKRPLCPAPTPDGWRGSGHAARTTGRACRQRAPAPNAD